MQFNCLVYFILYPIFLHKFLGNGNREMSERQAVPILHRTGITAERI